MKFRFLTLACTLLFIQCKEEPNADCPPNSRLSEYTITGKCTGNTKKIVFNRVNVEWATDSSATFNFSKDTCNSKILGFNLRDIPLQDTMYSLDTIMLPFATISDSDIDVTYTPLKNSYCTDCYVWLNRVDANTFFIDVKLAFVPWATNITRFLGVPTDSVYVEAELMLKKN